MIHRKARRLLPAVLDHTLPATLEAAVRDHADACPDCADSLAELQAAEALLLRLPASLVPLEVSGVAEERLESLARWAGRMPALWPERLGLQAVGALAGAALVALVIAIGDWEPVVKQPHTYQSFASILPGDPGLSGWR